MNTFEQVRRDDPIKRDRVILTVIYRSTGTRRTRSTTVPAALLAAGGADFEESVYSKLKRALRDDLADPCVVSFMGCKEKGIVGLVAGERGRFAGRDWEPGDLIAICPAHAHDVYRAADQARLEDLPEWLRADVRRSLEHHLHQYDLGIDQVPSRPLWAG